MERKKIAALRMERQFLTRKANLDEYNLLYRDTQPGQNVYWHGFGDPPSITYRSDFDDIAYNRERQHDRTLVKGRFQGGNLGWVLQEDLELFAGMSKKPIDRLTEKQELLMDIFTQDGPMNIQLVKEITGMLVKEITPVLHRLQEAFLIYEDQYDGEWDRAWYLFPEMFPDVDITRYSRIEALCTILPRFAYRNVVFDSKMAKSFYKLPEKDIKAAISCLIEKGELVAVSDGQYMLKSDEKWLSENDIELPHSVYLMHRNDFLVKSNEHVLKKQFHHEEFDTLQYLLIDGEFHGAVVGKFKYGPYILEDVLLDLPNDIENAYHDEIIEVIYSVNGNESLLKCYMGKEI